LQVDVPDAPHVLLLAALVYRPGAADTKRECSDHETRERTPPTSAALHSSSSEVRRKRRKFGRWDDLTLAVPLHSLKEVIGGPLGSL
jgi:hypothetical protein